MTDLDTLLTTGRALIGMVHLHALPGTPGSALSVQEIAARAADEATLLEEAGFDAIILENMHDVPYLRHATGPEIVASMTAVGTAVREAAPDVPLGVQILSGNNPGALAVAQAIDAQFIRTEGFVFAAIADEGLLDEACAGDLLRYRKTIGAEHIKVFADVKKKHSSHALTADVDIAETAKAAVFFKADGLIVTGVATAQPTDVDDLAKVKAAVPGTPVLVGSGVTPDTAAELLHHADGLIVGSWYKHDGLWSNAPDPQRAREIVAAVKG